MNSTKMITAMSTSAVTGALNFDELRSFTSAATTASLPAHRVARVADTVQIGDVGAFVSSASIRNAADSSFPSGRPTHRNSSSRTYNRHEMPMEYDTAHAR
jgi:hypothetical protein